MPLTSKTTGYVLISLAVVFSLVLFLIISAIRPLSGLENTMLQLMSLAVGLGGSFLVGRETARETAREIIKPHAKSAFRRLLSLYGSLARLDKLIQSSRPLNDTDHLHPFVLDKLDVMVQEQLVTAVDALEDWRDIVPEEVQEVRSRLQASATEQERFINNE